MTIRNTIWAALFLALPHMASAAPAPPKVLSPSAILEDVATGKVLWQHNPDAERPMASTTKMMTALLVVESGRLDEVVTVSHNAATVKESSLNLKGGEHLTLRNVLYGIVLRSANDACVAAAEHIAGGVPAFVERMNARAVELGCRHTHFINPNGLQAAGHYSTARDLAIIARAVLADPVLKRIVATPHYTIVRDKNKYDTTLISRFRWFLDSYPGADGVKTGHTREAGRCFVGAATHHGFHLVSVVLHSGNVKADTEKLLNWGFKYYRGGVAVKGGDPLGSIAVTGGLKSLVPVVAAGPVRVTLPLDAPSALPDLSGLRVPAPVRKGQALGSVPLKSDGDIVGFVSVVAGDNVEILRSRQMGRAALFVTVFGTGALIGTIAKNSRRRRRRLAARRGGTDPRRARPRERTGSPNR